MTGVQTCALPISIQKAIAELDRRTLIKSVPGKGSFISDNALELMHIAKEDELQDIKTQLISLKMAGITKEDVISCVDEVFGDSSSNNMTGGQSND